MFRIQIQSRDSQEHLNEQTVNWKHTLRVAHKGTSQEFEVSDPLVSLSLSFLIANSVLREGSCLLRKLIEKGSRHIKER